MGINQFFNDIMYIQLWCHTSVWKDRLKHRAYTCTFVAFLYYTIFSLSTCLTIKFRHNHCLCICVVYMLTLLSIGRNLVSIEKPPNLVFNCHHAAIYLIKTMQIDDHVACVTDCRRDITSPKVYTNPARSKSL